MEEPNELIENLFLQFQSILKADLNKYRNHVYRVFFNCMLLDNTKENSSKYAIASFFHDIGLWTKNTFDYIDPSIEKTMAYLSATKNERWIEEISLMIYWHHKMTSYKGPYETTVENFRKADWIDLSFGLLNFGVDKPAIKKNIHEISNDGFHWFLIKRFFKNLVTHPLSPFPMFKR